MYSHDMKKSNPYSSPTRTLRMYWKAYGGFGALVTSPYFHVALLLAIPGALFSPKDWADKSLSTIPALLGLSLAGYAILLALGSREFFEVIRRKKRNGRPSVLEGVATSFFHFLVVQFAAIMLSLIHVAVVPALPAVKEWIRGIGCRDVTPFIVFAYGFVGWLSLFYSVTCMIALSFRLYRLILLVCHFEPKPVGDKTGGQGKGNDAEVDK